MRLVPKLPPGSELSRSRDNDDVILELLMGWDARRVEYLARAHRYCGVEGDNLRGRADELYEVMEELMTFFPGARELFEE